MDFSHTSDTFHRELKLTRFRRDIRHDCRREYAVPIAFEFPGGHFQPQQPLQRVIVARWYGQAPVAPAAYRRDCQEELDPHRSKIYHPKIFVCCKQLLRHPVSRVGNSLHLLRCAEWRQCTPARGSRICVSGRGWPGVCPVQRSAVT